LQAVQIHKVLLLLMLKNYLTIAIRHLLKNKTFSIINILGLSTGIACCLLLSLYIQDEFSYEKQFKDYDRVYRMYTTFTKDGVPESFPRTSPPIAIDLIDELPEIETATRVVSPPEVEVHIIHYGDKVFYEKRGVLVDSTFLQVFPYTLKEGDPGTALDAPATVLLSEKLATKIFNDKSALDEVLIINSGRASDTFRIAGVIKATSSHSHVDADFYLSMNSDGWGKWIAQQRTWAWNNFVGSYVKLKSGTSAQQVDSKFPQLIEKHAGKDLKQAGLKKELHLQPLKDIRLYSDFSNQFGDTGSGGIIYVYILGSIGIFILMLACINFMNLTTAKATQRAGEVGVRKSMGANRSTLIGQFLGESMTIVFASLIISLAMVTVVLPYINNVTEKELAINATNIGFISVSLLVIGLVTGLLAGSYPAFFLSAFEPANVLKNKNLNGDGSSWLRKCLVVCQFIIAITLISSIIIIQQQLQYIKDKPLGFRKDHVIMIPLHTEEASNQVVTLRNEFKQITGVREVSATTSLPSTPIFRDFALYAQGSTADKGVLHRVIHVDEAYFAVLDIKLKAGRDFIAEKDTFSYSKPDNRIIVNEACLKIFNIDINTAIGSVLLSEYEGKVRKHEIIGVVEDFHQFSLHQPILPMLFVIPAGRNHYNYLTASVDGHHYTSTLSNMKSAWDKVVKDAPFDSSLLTDSIKKQYESDTKISLLLTWSTVLAILICCLGLYGLSIYVAERKVKEIGIRKVLGASVFNIVRMLSIDFIKLVFIAFIIAVPLGYYIMDRWLENFAFKIELGYTIFILAGVFSFLIAWLTISFESIRAAVNNPVKALKNE
jgi:putative ABC transport system permease protein